MNSSHPLNLNGLIQDHNDHYPGRVEGSNGFRLNNKTVAPVQLENGGTTKLERVISALTNGIKDASGKNGAGGNHVANALRAQGENSIAVAQKDVNSLAKSIEGGAIPVHGEIREGNGTYKTLTSQRKETVRSIKSRATQQLHQRIGPSEHLPVHSLDDLIQGHNDHYPGHAEGSDGFRLNNKTVAPVQLENGEPTKLERVIAALTNGIKDASGKNSARGIHVASALRAQGENSISVLQKDVNSLARSIEGGAIPVYGENQGEDGTYKELASQRQQTISSIRSRSRQQRHDGTGPSGELPRQSLNGLIQDHNDH
ncbi:hypothetical protein, partial [uncultured Roseibium sp.]